MQPARINYGHQASLWIESQLLFAAMLVTAYLDLAIIIVTDLFILAG